MTIFMLKTRNRKSDIKLNKNENEKQDLLQKSPKLFETMHSQKVFLIVLVSLLLAFFSASETIFFAFSATYFQYIPLKLSASKAAEVVSAMAMTFTISRGMAILIAIRTKPQKIIAIFLSILLLSMFILFFATNSMTMLWTGMLGNGV